ncbi:MAG: 2OG-Fe(II) oxygenase, partial [Candidatus Rokuibacteriota bacterium]
MGKRTVTPIAEKLHVVLARIDRPAAFCVWGALGAVLPGLEVEGVGSIGLPLTTAQARALRRRCEQAPYGKGAQTLVDTRVRRVWRLAPSRFALTNPGWPEFLGAAVARVQTELGLERQRLTAYLHDLLLYEEGCFFKPHRDGEKRNRMVATLVITLPAVHGGGELVVRHEGQEQIVDFSGPESRHQIQFAAFYADCEHEVRPLRTGHRLCLVYNLTLAKSRAPLGAPLSQGHIAEAAQVLREWTGATGGPQKLAVTLAHRYTADGLAWDALKGIDGARARVLAAAARQADCHVALALLTFWEHGSAEYDDEPYGRGWGGRGRHADGQYSMGEVLDWGLSAKRWRSPEGERLSFGEIPFEKEEVVPPDSLTDVEPKEDF